MAVAVDARHYAAVVVVGVGKPKSRLVAVAQHATAAVVCMPERDCRRVNIRINHAASCMRVIVQLSLWS